MKKLIKPLAIIISAITMTVPAYAITSHSFNSTAYTADNKMLSTNEKISYITLSNNVYGIFTTDDCVYIEYHNVGSNCSYIYRCSNDLKERTLIAAIPGLAYSLCYYDNSIYYINPVKEDYSINEICSLNIDTKTITKHITYNGEIELYGICNGYIYFTARTPYPLSIKIYKQNINNSQDKKLMYYSSKNYISDYAIGENKLYISNFKTIDVIDLKTRKIINSYDNSYELLGEYKGRLYLYNKGYIYKALENNLVEPVSDKTEFLSDNLYPTLMTNNKIQFTSYNYDISTYYIYEYDIDTNKWKLLESYIY